ncbi:MAG TPA: SHOCT domain-containing protein [Bacteroidia bacterium]|nr:SHOCT domain-containing protein [Bacteroidia bacterium]
MKALFTIWLCLVFSLTAFSQNEYNNFVVERKNVQKQIDEMLRSDKAFKNRNATAEFQALIRKLLELDDKIILSANYTVNTLQNENKDLEKQANLKPKTIIKTVHGKTVTVANDSIYDALFIAQNRLTNLNDALKAKDGAFDQLLNKSDSLIVANKTMQARFDALMADNKALNEKNIVLIVFNSLVAVGLILSLFFLLRKPVAKKMLLNTPESEKPLARVEHSRVLQQVPVAKPVEVKPEPVIKVSPEGIFSASHDALDFKLDQIEKLARLKEKGYLTDEEFNIQKRQILGV